MPKTEIKNGESMLDKENIDKSLMDNRDQLMEEQIKFKTANNKEEIESARQDTDTDTLEDKKPEEIANKIVKHEEEVLDKKEEMGKIGINLSEKPGQSKPKMVKNAEEVPYKKQETGINMLEDKPDQNESKEANNEWETDSSRQETDLFVNRAEQNKEEIASNGLELQESTRQDSDIHLDEKRNNLEHLDEKRNNLEHLDKKRNNLEHLDEKRINLELYLHHVYEKECEIQAENEEVEFIQTGIEALVQGIADNVREMFSEAKELDEVFDKEDYKKEIKTYFQNTLQEIYFPIKGDSHFQNLTNLKPKRCSIVKVGSFYEKTKNKFPKEFDFIYLLFCGRDKLTDMVWLYINLVLSVCVCKVTKHKNFQYASLDGTKKLHLHKEKAAAGHGPAAILQFIYTDFSGKERFIDVDLVPAYRIVVACKLDWFVQIVNKKVKPKTFKEMIMAADACTQVQSHLSFTEFEVRFIGQVISKKHRKVYRLLKFLINGHGDDEVMDVYMKRLRQEKGQGYNSCYPYSSYMMKTMMIYHHDECRNTKTADVGPCVVQVLEEMCKYDKFKDFPAFSDVRMLSRTKCMKLTLQSLVEILKSMQIADNSYDLETSDIKSVTRQYMDSNYADRLSESVP